MGLHLGWRKLLEADSSVSLQSFWRTNQTGTRTSSEGITRRRQCGLLVARHKMELLVSARLRRTAWLPRMRQRANSASRGKLLPACRRGWRPGEPRSFDTGKLPANATTNVLPLSNVLLLPPVPRPAKIVAVGLNYKDHSIESGASAPPKSPIIFAKFPTSIVGPEDAIVIPVGNPNVDYEAKLAVVIGRRERRFLRRTHSITSPATCR